MTKNITVETITEKDVLCGRGGMANKWPGNKAFREMIKENKDIYQDLSNHAVRKQLLVSSIIQSIQYHGGRFLRRKSGKHNNNNNGMVWVEISPKEAYIKTSQALRDQDNKPYESDVSSSSSVASDGRMSPSEHHSQFRLALRQSSLKKKHPSLRAVSADEDDGMNKENYLTTTDTSSKANTTNSKMAVPEIVDVTTWDVAPHDLFCPLDPNEFVFESADEFSHLCTNLLEQWSH